VAFLFRHVLSEQNHITVVVCTRDRGDSVARAVESILNNDYDSFHLLVIDQSDDSTAWNSLTEWLGDPRFEYVSSATRGLARARNLALSIADDGIVAMTDDDCEVAPDWLEQIAESFRVSEKIGIVMGNVLRGPHDETRGFIPGYVRTAPFIAKGISDKSKVEGIGACMAIRKSVWESIGGFDVMLGAGTDFHSADDTDFIIRALLHGYFVYENPAVVVTHHGFRTHDEADALTRGYLSGIGATLAKHLKSGRLEMLRLMWSLGARWSVSQPVVEYGFKPARLPRLSGFVRGFTRGVLTPANRSSGMFDDPLPRVAEGKTTDRESADV
jgi:GT2 family glycosyltransferase